MRKEQMLALTLLAAALALPVQSRAGGEQAAAKGSSAAPAASSLADCTQKAKPVAVTASERRKQLVAERQAAGSLPKGEQVRYNPDAAKHHGSKE